ncbi:tetraacyldisaccharide 4'-kinase [Calditerrivibrio nitroreducens]|uniref:Tetraacyldisaccharide 4'-kinase n=1 Tax=Calditerrivibrio nitroreducens (strain DSM 19672 / NBRC 101217 / Yu37-1) TaxID=768670 RepID=E4TI48_CALNY|nr:tetraacyldisaccharide 4'-kinase [Calditerrivibrio nitroreducens]ADR18964.1 tetraacyldisaccharide 4'-kinase [Calditerrivibrio nitroreducens DSM 19672]
MAKIISVGNISMGGTGKTPVVIKLGRYFLDAGKKVSIVSRGYRGKIGYSINVISDGEKIYHHPPYAADEPYMIAKILEKASVVTGKDRRAVVEFVSTTFNPDIIILDDAYHRKDVRKDLDLLLLDYKNPISTGFVFPFGYLRESPSAIKRADIVLFTKTGGEKVIPEKVKKFLDNKPVFFSDVEMMGVFLGNEELTDKNIRFLAFSGIANNTQFFDFLRKKGLNILDKKGFSDHHNYTLKDFNNLINLLKKTDADYLVTTEKDFVKLNDEIKQITAYIKIEIKIFDEEKFFGFVNRKLYGNT